MLSKKVLDWIVEIHREKEEHDAQRMSYCPYCEYKELDVNFWLWDAMSLKELLQAIREKHPNFDPENCFFSKQDLPNIITIKDKVIAVVRIPSSAKTLPASGKDLRKRL